MEKSVQTLMDVKKLRLERHWSQEQLAEFSGLSTRTIQRIESGHSAGFESTKALAAVFEVDLQSDKQQKAAYSMSKEEEAYVANVKGIYKMTGIAIISLLVPFVLAIANGEWTLFLWVLLSWLVIIGVLVLNTFQFFGESWGRKILSKRKK